MVGDITTERKPGRKVKPVSSLSILSCLLKSRISAGINKISYKLFTINILEGVPYHNWDWDTLSCLLANKEPKIENNYKKTYYSVGCDSMFVTIRQHFSNIANYFPENLFKNFSNNFN